ncbi:CarD family transcriptional regulator [Pallidibacillus pasinlerensis]|uniref:CarD-like/TRCF RNAP-interacting domain-containing protein n=1 Tax=Pallidibacillus pasinlerensis TaxID=2703818 RepID=A0ABX0A084_9BACI|nr:CarD family transcriptional regulator [Pallidibacillus pasinlerensis]NCU16819.1 hypothetical protein [Pallidibacillus pasinlerensis]
MFKKGDLMMYTEHGICQIVDITERTIDETTKKYYIIQPLENNQQLTISIPVDRANAMKKMLKKKEAEEILGLFHKNITRKEKTSRRRGMKVL